MGAEFNHRVSGQQRLAIHGRTRVLLGEFLGADDRFILEDLVGVDAPRIATWEPPLHWARIGALAWVGDGKHLVADIGGLKEDWQLFELGGDGRSLEPRTKFYSCNGEQRDDHESMGLDVVALNREVSIDEPPTPTASVTPSNTPTATESKTVTATPTTVPHPIYLPLALREVPCTRKQPADVVLVIDASSSMEEPAGDGRTKRGAAWVAAVAFVDGLRLGVSDQVAVVAFNSDARVVIGLTADRPAITTALGSITTGSQTCLVCGLETAGKELNGAGHLAGNQAVIILLTDGRSNPQPASEAVSEAARLKDLGTAIFTIGLGAELDDAALTAIASRPQFAHHATDGTALEAIYREIAVTLPGPADCYWGQRR